jgi:hypothetical protein
MRRLAASLLLTLLCAGLTLPLLLQTQGDGVPACCRRSGKHHCAKPAQSDGIKTSATNCPQRSFTALTSHFPFLKTVTHDSSVSSLFEMTSAGESPDLPLRLDGNAQKRGPPPA